MELGNVNYSFGVGLLNPMGFRSKTARIAKLNNPGRGILTLSVLVSTSTGRMFWTHPGYSTIDPIARTIKAFSSYTEAPTEFSRDSAVQGEHVDHHDWIVHNEYEGDAAATYIPLTAEIKIAARGELIVTEEDRKIINEMIKASTAELNASIRELAAEIRSLRDIMQSEIRGLRDVMQTEVKRLDQSITTLNERLDDIKSGRRWAIGTFIGVLIAIFGSAVQIYLHFTH